MKKYFEFFYAQGPSETFCHTKRDQIKISVVPEKSATTKKQTTTQAKTQAMEKETGPKTEDAETDAVSFLRYFAKKQRLIKKRRPTTKLF